MTSKYKKINLDLVETHSIDYGKRIVNSKAFCQTLNRKSSLEDLLSGFPDILAGKDFKEFIHHTRKAIKNKNQIILMMGAHSIKCGLTPMIKKLIQNKIISHLALNGAGAIHDIEMALYGETSENVLEGLKDGSFGMCRDTADFINEAINTSNQLGYGESIGRKLTDSNASAVDNSLIYQCYSYDIPVTVHSAMGTEINHQHPSLNPAQYGEKSVLDFKIFTKSVSMLKQGSIVINIGSAVIMPEVFLKSLTIARNLKYNCFGFHTAVFDMIKHYRPLQNVTNRPTQSGGKGYYFIGHFELMLPVFIGLLFD